jgi:hypothetical protein
VVELRKGEPFVGNFDELLPDTGYLVIIGGVNCEESFRNRFIFRTLLASHHIKSSTRFLFLRESHIDCTAPDEQSIWQSINMKLSRHEANISPIHSICYNGNSLSIESRVRKHITELIGWLLRDEISVEALDQRMAEIESTMNACYRHMLASQTIGRARKSCGNIFLAGESEALSQLILWLEMENPNATKSNHHNQPNSLLSDQEQISSDANMMRDFEDIFDESKSHEIKANAVDNNNELTDDSGLLRSSAPIESISEADQAMVKHYMEEKKLRDQRSSSLQQLLDDDAIYERSILDKPRAASTNEDMESLIYDDILYQGYELAKFEAEVRRSVAGLVGRAAR